jgi:hypothetical protein
VNVPLADLLLLTGADDFELEGLEVDLLEESSFGFEADFWSSSKSGLVRYSSRVLTKDNGA